MKTPLQMPHTRHFLQYASILKSCIAQKAVEPGKQVHARLFINGVLLRNLNLATQVVNLYVVCNSLPYAHRLFDRIPKSNIFLWNILIRAYACNGPYEAAISLYHQLLGHGLVPDNFTLPCVLKACSSLSDIKLGRRIYDQARETGSETDVFVGAALVDMYAKCGCVSDARKVFDKITDRDIVLWNSMLSAYSQNGHPQECLKLCGEMALLDFRPTEATLVTAMAACADSTATIQGRELHGHSWRLGFEFNDKVRTGLVDMYAKCGNVIAARILFEDLLDKRLISWNVMISGYAMHGHTLEALDLFKKMAEKVQPDQITFVGVLSACKHGGLVDEGRMYFDSMITDYHIEPRIEHYTSMVALLGHFNRLDEAYCIIMNMRVAPDPGVWGALLHSCKIHGNIELGELALERLIELKPDEAGNYVILSNIYAQAGKWEKVSNLRRLMVERKIKKNIGCSWIEVRTRIHAFVSGDSSHPLSEEIYAELGELGELLSEEGYIPNVSPIFYDVENDEKTQTMSSHSERLAIAFGLISTAAGTKLLITKNLRICEDCHVVIKLISRVKEREITIRDVNRYHHFKDGKCSCGDYW